MRTPSTTAPRLTRPGASFPANKKWFRDVAIAQAIIERLRPLRDGWTKELESRGDAALKQLRAMRQQHS